MTSCPFSETFNNKTASPCRRRTSANNIHPALRQRHCSRPPQIVTAMSQYQMLSVLVLCGEQA